MRGRHHRLTPESAPRVEQSRSQAALRFAKKNTHRRPSRADRKSDGLDGRGIWCGRWLIDLGSAVKPLMESESQTSTWLGDPGSGSALLSTKNPLPGRKWACIYEDVFVVTLHHFLENLHSRVGCYRVVRYAGSYAPFQSHTTNPRS